MSMASPEMLHCLSTPGNVAGNGTDMTVLERQRFRMKWQQEQFHHQQQQQLQESYYGGNQFSMFSMGGQDGEAQQFHGLIDGDSAGSLGDLLGRTVKADPGLENVWPEFGKLTMPGTGFNVENAGFESSGILSCSGFEMNHDTSRTSSCLQSAAEVEVRESVLPEKIASTVGRESFKKRKADKIQSPKVHDSFLLSESLKFKISPFLFNFSELISGLSNAQILRPCFHSVSALSLSYIHLCSGYCRRRNQRQEDQRMCRGWRVQDHRRKQ